MTGVSLIVLAKAPVPGRSKTRLTPPLSPLEAAALAEAALADTLAAALAAQVTGRRLLVLEGRPGAWLPPGFELVAQRRGGLGDRLAGAFEAAGETALLVGMDTPQLTALQIEHGMSALARPGVDAVLGAAPDGGYWTIGLQRPDARVFDGVPMSSPSTAVAQRRRLGELGLRTVELPSLRDVDTVDDARAVAHDAPGTRFARTVGRLGGELVLTSPDQRRAGRARSRRRPTGRAS